VRAGTGRADTWTVRRSLALLALSLALVPTAGAAPLLGVRGDLGRFRGLTGQRTDVGHVMIGWGQGYSWGGSFARLLSGLGDVPMVSVGTGRGWPDRREAITPRGIALGEGDGFLVALNRALAEHGPVYLRPLAEMNGHWNFYSAYDEDGTRRDEAHSTRWFRKAFARIHVIAHGGPAAEIDAELTRLGLPPLGRDLPVPDVRVIWNPQGYGSPDLPGNSARAYYPGDRFVDVVGDDLYDIRGKAEWDAAEALYDAHPGKPFAFPEWGLWGVDDPEFVRRMARFVRSHRRVELLVYFESKPGSVFDLGTKPRSLAAYREAIAGLGR
jgi:hypothetical protein